jgi:hypothetical protein
MEGMISWELVELQKYALIETESRMSVETWARELIIKLLEITHGQWLYRNVVVHMIGLQENWYHVGKKILERHWRSKWSWERKG